MSGGGPGDFERWLERELRHAIADEPGSRPRAADAAYRAAGDTPVQRRIAGLGLRGAAAIAAVTVVAAGGAGGAVLATGSTNPVSWGESVVQAVSMCADQSGANCVSALAGQRSPTPAEAHATGRPAVHPQPSRQTPDPGGGGRSNVGDGSDHGPSGDSGQGHGQKARGGSGATPSPSPTAVDDAHAGNGHGHAHSPSASPDPSPSPADNQ